MKMGTITIKDIAKRAGVSIASVSRCLNDSPLIAVDTKERIKAVIKECQYSRNSIARSFVNQATHTIAFIVDSQNFALFGNPYFLQLQYGLEKMLGLRGYYLMIVNMNSGVHGDNTINKLIAEKRVDGIILPEVLVKNDIANTIIERNFPCVVLGKPHEDTRISWVDLDNVMGGEVATTHLLDHGCKKIVFIGTSFKKIFVAQRLEGYKSALMKRNIKCSHDLIFEGYEGKGKGREIMNTLLSMECPPDGFLFSDNITAFGALSVATERGVKIPEEIQIVSYDDTIVSRIATPEISVVDIDMFELGSQAATMVLEQLEAPSKNKQQSLLSVKLACRGTTKND
jgi:DNA-binding LacI/PurR family transcriptional regulator